MNSDTSGNQLSEEERLIELQETAEVVAKLAEDDGAFARALKAFRAKDAEQFPGELSKIQ